jgi:hypothetical protein
VTSGPAIYSSGMIHLTGVAGTVVLNAYQAGDASYSSVSNNTSFTVSNSKRDLTSESGTREITIFPNPSNGVLSVISGQPLTTGLLYSIEGKLVYDYNFNGMNNSIIDLSAFSKGIYFLHIRSGGNENEIVKKIVLE